MGWWKNDAGEVVGDDAVDALSRDLRALVDAIDRKLTVPELLGHLHSVLDAKSADLLASRTPVPALVADVELFGDDAPINETLAMTRVEDTAIRQHIDAMCARVSALYEGSMQRRPTLEEMLECFRFPLGSRPDALVALPRDASVRAIRVP